MSDGEIRKIAHTYWEFRQKYKIHGTAEQDWYHAKYVYYQRLAMKYINTVQDQNQDQNQDQDKCSICLSSYSSNYSQITLSCYHTFDLECLNQWLKHSLTCPMCRKNILN